MNSRSSLGWKMAGGPVALFASACLVAGVDDPVPSPQPPGQLRVENQELRALLEKQQQVIDALGRRVADLESSRPAKGAAENDPAGSETPRRSSVPNLIISGEGAVAFFHSGARGAWPNSEFAVDEAKLFFDARLFENLYLFSEINLITREADPKDRFLQLGELYFDWEDLGALWGWDKAINLRAGRFDIPFGEEYLHRDAIDNALITHSAADIWGVDEGIELYGSVRGIQYALAVQNGGHDLFRDFNRDKAIIGRVGYDPTRWLHLSASAMRTGELDVQRDKLSEVWIGNGFFSALGAKATTFHADLVEGDVEVRWNRGRFRAAAGLAAFDDDDPTADNRRNLFYYSAEGSQDLTSKVFVAARFSQILVDGGYPLIGNGSYPIYMFPTLTTDLWRLSFGAGLRWSKNFVIKAEYSFERGDTSRGDRSLCDLIAAQLAGKF